MSQLRNWMFTFWQSPTDEMCKDTNIRYLIIGSQEECPTTKRVHWHGYGEFKKAVRVSALRKIFTGIELWCGPREGTRDQARAYCIKTEGEYREFGCFATTQGQRHDLMGVSSMILEQKMSLEDVIREAPSIYCRYKNGLKDIQAVAIRAQSRGFRKLEVVLITGPTGCGKTSFAMETAQFIIHGSKLQWWNDYEGQDIILIDEYNNNINIDELLALLDGYQLRLQVKGSHTYALWTKVFITTNLKLQEIHPNAKPAHRAALFRRITEIKDFW